MSRTPISAVPVAALLIAAGPALAQQRMTPNNSAAPNPAQTPAAPATPPAAPVGPPNANAVGHATGNTATGSGHAGGTGGGR